METDSLLGPSLQVVVAPKVLLNKRNHRVVTDQEDIQERNWMNKGKVGKYLTWPDQG